MPHGLPLRVVAALLLLLAVMVGLAYAAIKAHRRRRRPPHGIRIDLVGGDKDRPEPPANN
ncbi:MAG TPA: hypothetical protein VFW19_00595 [Allosphingosinicella sp.]|nr:hypothetical protein [Allosphingosinicella sp.]